MVVTEKILLGGMQCTGCEKIIEEAVLRVEGVIFAKANLKSSSLKVQFDDEKTSLENIKKACLAKGYPPLSKKTSGSHPLKNTLIVLAFGGLIALLFLAKEYGYLLPMPEINSQMGSGMILLVGLLTGLHCIGMCGSFIIGYTSRDAEHNSSFFRSHILYGLGKTASYTILGAFFGFLGSIFHISPLVGGISIALAGLFLILYGLNMLHILSTFKIFQFRQPLALSKFMSEKARKSNSPFYIGFFSGFILGCGPLQVMYVMAAGNGDPLQGAKLLALFGLGTLPALFCFGFLARLLSKNLTRHFIQASGILILILGSMMLYKGIDRSLSEEKVKAVQVKHSCCEQMVIRKV